MARILIIGATGETGMRTVRQLKSAGHQPYGLHRHAGQAESLRAQGAVPVKGDLLTLQADALSALLMGMDAVIFTAGSNGGGDDLTDKIDGDGVVLTATAAKLAGVKRMLLVSAFPDAWRDRHMPADFEHYMFVKRQADVYLAGTDLEWVIVRPGTLTTQPGTGHVRLGLAIPYGDVSRDNLAAVLVRLVETPEVRRVILELTDGDTPICDAIAAARSF